MAAPYNIDEEFPRLRKLKEARAARMARQNTPITVPGTLCSPSKQHKTTTCNLDASPVSVAFDLNRNAALDTQHTPADHANGLLQATYQDVCHQVSQLDLDIQKLLARGTHLAEQTVLDAEAHHHSTYGLTFTNTIESIVQGFVGGNLPVALCATPTAATNTISTTTNSTSSNTTTSNITAPNTTNTAHTVLNLQYCSVRVTELQSKHRLRRLGTHLRHWKTSYRLRCSIRKRLSNHVSSTPTSLAHAATHDFTALWLTVHRNVGRGTFHPNEIFRRDGKHRMAKEYQQHRMARICFGRWMMRTCCFQDERTESTCRGRGKQEDEQMVFCRAVVSMLVNDIEHAYK